MELSGIVVSVGFGDLLSVTLPRNARHFSRIVVVTVPPDRDPETHAAVALSRKQNPACEILTYETDEFYRHGAVFNKGLALDSGFDVLGSLGGSLAASGHVERDCSRYAAGWIVVFDADTLFPASLSADLDRLNLNPHPDNLNPASGRLYTPRRRILANVAAWPEYVEPEHHNRWHSLPLKKEGEFPGYFQLFHSSDPVLHLLPWYPTDWTHAGGCDSFFQFKWPKQNKIRPPFEVLHLGECGENWCGRVGKKVDGTVPAEADERRRQLRDFITGRQIGSGKFDREKIKLQQPQ